MIQTADLKPKVMRLWGNPSSQELSPQGLRDAVENIWNIILMEMSIVSPNYGAKFSDTFTLPDGFVGDVNVGDLALATAIEYRTSGATDESAWVQVDTGSIENWDFYKTNGQSVALLTGGVGGLTLRTNFNAQGGEFRLRYISDGQVNDSGSPLGAAIELPSFFSPMFEAGAAWKAGDFIVTDRDTFASTIPSKQQAFNAEFLMYLGRYKQWLRSSRAGKGVQFRTPSDANRVGRRWRGSNLGFPR